MIFVYFLAVYFLLGLVCAMVFLLIGYKWMLADATGSALSVRLLWFPAAVAIWPLLVWKWGCKWRHPAHKEAHKEGGG